MNQLSRGSLTTSSGLTSKWLSSHSAVAIRSGSRVETRPVSNHASGRASLTWTSASLSSRSWWSTTQRGSPKPLGLVSSASTSGCGTCSPRIRIRPAIVLVPLRPAPATNSTLRGYAALSISACSLGFGRVRRPGCSRVANDIGAPRVSVRDAMVFGRRRGPGPDARASWSRPTTWPTTCPPAWTRSWPPRTHQLDVVVVDDGSPDASGEIAEQYAARDPRVRVVHIDNRGLGRGPQRGAAARPRRLRRVRRLRRRRPADGVRRPGRHPGAERLGPRDRLDRALGGRRPRRAAVDAPAAQPARHGPEHPRPPRAARRRVRVEQGLPALVLGATPGWPGPRGSATRTSRRPPARSWPPTGSTSSPTVVYHWRIRARRHLDHPAARPRCATSRTGSRPSGWRSRASTRTSPAPTTRGPATCAEVFVDRVLAGDLHRYFAEIPGLRRRLVGAAARRHRRALGRPLADAQRAHPGAPADRLAGGAGPPRGRRRRGDVRAGRGRPLDRVDGPDGVRVDVPGSTRDRRPAARSGRARASDRPRLAGTVAAVTGRPCRRRRPVLRRQRLAVRRSTGPTTGPS